ncbi:MAG: imidazole glycerol phosphate synthase subunit HisH [Chloroflexi bacterium]|nr:imidazole glycerol phosphate synthase subunit HisH [Chloroflexota bacterium]|tara:strand:- start:4764 stop:5399 length:636 start_codon:yes stop_codon:yes gene_type:complete
MKNQKIAVIDHKCANLHSVIKALDVFKVDVKICRSKTELQDIDGIILPGVGSFDPAMRNLIEQDLDDPIKKLTLSGTPLLGICLGMQLLMENSEEGSLNGIGLVNGTAKIIESTDKEIKIPHMGWNNIEINNNNSRILNGIKDNDYFYFVHSYKCIPTNYSEMTAFTKYGQDICAVIEKNNIFATQFHPEKSGKIGLKIYQNFLSFIETGK